MAEPVPETLRARDERVYARPKPPAVEYLRHASRVSGRGFLTGEVLAFFGECGARLRGR